MWPEEGAGEIRNHPNGWHLYGLTVHGSQSTFPCIYSLILLSAQNMLVLEVKDSLRSNENIIPTYRRSESWLVWNEVTDQRKLFSSVEKLHFISILTNLVQSTDIFFKEKKYSGSRLELSWWDIIWMKVIQRYLFEWLVKALF